jgi:hypothetical protein
VAYYNLDSSLFNYTFDLAKRAIGGWDWIFTKQKFSLL